MDIKQALAKLRSLEGEGVAELVSVVEARIESLEADKFAVIGEKRTATSKLTALETALTAIAKAVGLEGDTEAILNGAEGKIRAIVSEVTQLRTDKTTLETRATEAEGKVQGLERKTKISQAAAKAGAAEAVLEKLLGDKVSELTIAEDGVKIGDKLLKDYVEADESLKLFMPALFPTAQTGKTEQKPATPKLPSGSPTGTTPEKTNPAEDYLKRTYTGLKTLTKTENPTN